MISTKQPDKLDPAATPKVAVAVEEKEILEQTPALAYEEIADAPEKSKKHRNKKPPEDILTTPKQDRRVLSYVPAADAGRTNIDRRGNVSEKDRGFSQTEWHTSTRFLYTGRVQVIVRRNGFPDTRFELETSDISNSGILLLCDDESQIELLRQANTIRLKFRIDPGAMPEGFECKINVLSTLCRVTQMANGKAELGFQFKEPLRTFIDRRRGHNMAVLSAVTMVFVTLFVIMMRAESILYFRFNKSLYLYSIFTAIFLLSRYFFGMLYRPVPVNPDYTPGVTLIIPCFNEEEWISRTIISCINQDYPAEQLEVIVVDDCSTDGSVEQIKNTVDMLLRDDGHYRTEGRIRWHVQEKNAGKRDALAVGAYMAKHELIIVVDSDSFLDPFAVRNLVQPFQDPKVGGVSGRTEVANTFTNWITKMQSTRYYIAFRIMKAAESYFDTVTCLSGPLSCYRKDLMLENMDAWLHQSFLGQRATFGDDRSLTNFVLRHHRTVYQDTAICSTIVPNQQKVFLKQQMRWKRSWLRESFIAASYIWKKEPFASLFFYMGLVVPFAAPIIVIYNLVWVPISLRVFPTTFLIGVLMMSLMMSIVYMLFRRNTIWHYGVIFCLYYELVLLWQMPFAWVTFWKSTWGTRLTPEDVLEAERKKERRAKKLEKRRQRSERGSGGARR